MNRNLARIKEIDLQLQWLNKVISEKSYMGCGLTVGVTLGPESEDSDDLARWSVSFGGGEEAVLKAIRAALQTSRDAAVVLARQDYADLQAHAALLGVK